MKNLVLLFHNVTDAKWFEHTLRFIGRHFEYGNLNDLYERLSNPNIKSPSRMCFVTFDDGERSVYEVVYPIIKKLNIPIAVFVSPLNICEGGSFWFQRIRQLDSSKTESLKQLSIKEIENIINGLDPEGKTNINSNISLEMMQELYDSRLVDFGAHTLTHPILANENSETAKTEITCSVEKLSQLLSKEILTFAYPNGTSADYTDREIAFLKQCGIKMAFTTQPRYANKIETQTDDIYRIPRIGISKGNKLFILTKLLFPKLWENLKKVLK